MGLRSFPRAVRWYQPPGDAQGSGHHGRPLGPTPPGKSNVECKDVTPVRPAPRRARCVGPLRWVVRARCVVRSS